VFVLYQRKTKIESSSAAQPALHADAAPPGLHNTIAHGKSQPCSPSLFSGKERTKDTEQRIRADTRAGIGYCDGQLAGAARTFSVPPVGMASTALKKRLIKTCFRCCGSPRIRGRSDGI